MSDEENDVFSGSVTSQPQMVNVQTSGPMYMVERSSAPQVIGILVIVYYILTTLMSLLGALSLEFISDIDETGQVEALPTGLLLGVIFLSLIPAVIGVFGGFKIFQYKKQGRRDVLKMKPLLVSLGYPPAQSTQRGVDNVANMINHGFDLITINNQ